MARSYVPGAGDIAWISFGPRTGHEQAGHRPAVVLSPAAYNAKTSLMVCCPMTTQIKNYPFEVVRQQVSLNDLALLLPRQGVKYFSPLAPCLAKQHLTPPLGHK